VLGSTGFLYAWAAMCLLCAAPASSLPTTYEEARDRFTAFVPPYDGTMQIESSITFAVPLPASLTFQDFAPAFEASAGTYSFFDGVMNYNLANRTSVDLRISTDNSGNITAWQVEIFSNARVSRQSQAQDSTKYCQVVHSNWHFQGARYLDRGPRARGPGAFYSRPVGYRCSGATQIGVSD
jgi:hypothetical protein